MVLYSFKGHHETPVAFNKEQIVPGGKWNAGIGVEELDIINYTGLDSTWFESEDKMQGFPHTELNLMLFSYPNTEHSNQRTKSES